MLKEKQAKSSLLCSSTRILVKVCWLEETNRGNETSSAINQQSINQTCRLPPPRQPWFLWVLPHPTLPLHLQFRSTSRKADIRWLKGNIVITNISDSGGYDMTVILPAVPEVATNRYSRTRNQSRGNNSSMCYCGVVLLTLIQDQLP